MHYLGIDIGGTKIKYVLFDSQGELIEKDQLLTYEKSNKQPVWKERILALISEISVSYAGDITCGISAPGLVDETNRMIRYMPDRLEGIEGFNWSEHANRTITVLNDGHAAALAEYESFYQKKNISNMLLLTLGTGVGGGIIIDGKIYQGNMQRAGHVGHMTIDHLGLPTMTNMPGSLEQALGNFSIETRSYGKYKSVHQLVKAYQKGEPLAAYWWLSSIQKLATALASLSNILSPEIIVLGGGIASGANKSLLKPLKEFINLYEWRPGGYKTKIKTVKHGSYAGAMGAAFFAKNQKNKKQNEYYTRVPK